jgi:hypothetical protein
MPCYVYIILGLVTKGYRVITYSCQEAAGRLSSWSAQEASKRCFHTSPFRA